MVVNNLRLITDIIMRKNSIRYMLLAPMVLVLLLTGCKESPIGQTKTITAAVSAVVIDKVVSIPGGATIYYKIPEDKNLSYVKAVYTRNGQTFTDRSSIYKNYLQVEGFLSQDKVDVTLYAVDHNQNESSPVLQIITPDEADIITTLKSINATTDFGGPSVTWTNINSAEMEIIIYADSSGTFAKGKSLYTAIPVGKYTFDGYKPKKTNFYFEIKDKFGNVTDKSKVFSLTPFNKVLIDKALLADQVKSRNFLLPGDDPSNRGAAEWPNMFDNNQTKDFEPNPSAPMNPWGESPGGFPYSYTINLGKPYKLSTIQVMGWTDFGTNSAFGMASLKKFELWGSLDPITDKHGDIAYNTNYREAADLAWWGDGGNPTDCWKTAGNGWFQFKGTVSEEINYILDAKGRFTITKPSAGEAITNDDLKAWSQGAIIKIEKDAPAVQYIRLRIYENFRGDVFFYMGELNIWGDDKF